MIDQISDCATRYRNALDQVSAVTWLSCTIADFPRGACGHCAELLARHLIDELGIHAEYVSGSVRGLVDGKFHAWLEIDGLGIDISADQFGLEPVIVEHGHWLHSNVQGRHPLIKDHWFAEYAAPVWNEAKAILERS